MPGIYPFSHYLPLLAAFLITWAVVGYFSSFYRDLELSNPIQLILNIVSQLACFGVLFMPACTYFAALM